MQTTPSQAHPVVFVHGLWLHAQSWHRWIEYFKQHGYQASAASWPGDASTTEDTRNKPAAVAGYGVAEIADHIAKQIQALDRQPILIGHSFGGLIVQNLLARELAVAAIAIDPAPIRGVNELPWTALRAALPVLANPLNFNRAVSLTEAQFRYGFANAVSEDEAHALYQRYAMPAPARPLFQAATAMLHPRGATAVRVDNHHRGPLLLIAGGADHTVPPVLVYSAARCYRNARAVTELHEFRGRGHSLIIDSGWSEVAQHCLGWIKSQSL
jgi:pimeloyl-ACP methyl ester carboxylesterase